ncbi:serine/threonine-protein kinase [Bifidobacterium sp. ESL0690]|uniref:serine/threonine protein kinase n=1 Tax=Bifidobacterium sp. ESL0690 TaxID=2983214 RepID=UPI0023F7E2FD|nr:serine/threonine-protein kinase [Bifidobacterium sp. ESL0690]WEV46290.1 serine/threonine-protein kinase [Bifidobacterium sp. ESL0690]
MANNGNRWVGKRYELLTEIGRGGMSTVYLALDATLHKQWAVKEIRHIPDKEQRRFIIDGLISEANLIKTFDHPAIPRIVDLIEENGSLYIVMDYIEGETLSKVLADQGPQDEETVTSWGIQLCDVLDYLHQRNPPIVYRDMKPSNVMVTPEGAVRVIDFGIACEMPPAKGPLPQGYEARMGTPGYAAPEQYDEFGRSDARTDVYGLGALLYVMLTGKPIKGEPYDAAPLRQVLPNASAGLERVLSKAMQRDPEQRYQDCAQFAYDLEHYSDRDAKRRKTMQLKWRTFCVLCVASVVALVGGGATLAAGAVNANSNYDLKMNLAAQSSDDNAAEAYYVTAANIRPSSIDPYEGMIKRYESDGVFSASEEQQLQQSLDDHSAVLQKQGGNWGRLCFDVGKLYWYYYSVDPSKSPEVGGDTIAQSQYLRITAASHWMNEASRTSFKDQKLAKLYATIADFNTTIVPLINEGSDAGKYAPYFKSMNTLMHMMQSSNNDVMKLSTVNTVLEALRTYSRKFRADGVTQEQLNKAIDAAQNLSQSVDPTTTKLRQTKDQATSSIAPARQAVAEAFVDIAGTNGAGSAANTGGKETRL